MKTSNVKTIKVRTVYLATIFCATVLLAAGGASGDNIYWDNPAGGFFDQFANWNPTQVPGPLDTAIFDLGTDPNTPYTVNMLFVGATNTNCHFLNDTVNFNMGNNPYTLTNELVVGNNDGDIAAVGMSGHLLTTTNAYMGKWANSHGSLTIGSEMMVNVGALCVGNDGYGKLIINNGTGSHDTRVETEHLQVSAHDIAEGHVEITGSDAKLTVTYWQFWVGDGGPGTMAISAGATVKTTHTDGCIRLGYGVTGDGEITVTGEGSLLEAETAGLIVGQRGIGTLTIDDGATVQTSDGSGWIELGYDVTEIEVEGIIVKVKGAGEITVQGGSTLEAKGAPILVGRLGEGTLNVIGGSTARSSGELFVASGVDATGDVLVSGGSQYISDSVYASRIGDAGTGTLTIDTGSLVQTGAMFIGAQATGNGTVTLNSDGNDYGALKTNRLIVGQAGTGLLEVIDRGVVALGNVDPANVDAGEVHMGDGAELRGTGTIEVDRVLNIGGELAPGGTDNRRWWATTLLGQLTIDGDYEQQAGGTLYIEINGDGQITESSLLYVTGTMTLGGTLTMAPVELEPVVPGEDLYFQPQAGDTFTILDWNRNDDIIGTFDTITDEDSWDISRLYSDGEITFIPEPATMTLLVLGGLAMLRRKRK